MIADAVRLLNRDLPVLFVYIGWADYYDGTEPIDGTHAYLQRHPRNCSESRAFFQDKEGIFSCGIGRGRIQSRCLHVVFVARRRPGETRRIVGAYPNASVELINDWALAETRHAAWIPPRNRPVMSFWPGDSGMRRWARRGEDSGVSHFPLLKAFRQLTRDLPRICSDTGLGSTADQIYDQIDGLDGVLRKRLIAHRRREPKLRQAKIRSVLEKNGRLVCEVKGCGFDFEKRYGLSGYGYAQVHHRAPLSQAGARGRRTTLEDLAIVCANCHAMIHRRGGCKPLRNLIPTAGRRGRAGPKA